ncbi:MAG TPA: hypothetical protein VKR53_16450 [Puia sp.]|nr:hypothetical protein [Puia sp.]
MEVHHHPHMEKKRFKEYFLEFLMIFLAVTMGFFAENIREYFSDNERVTQLSRELVQDLKKDTATLNENILQQAQLQKKADSVFKMLKRPLGTEDIKKIQRLIAACFESTIFAPSTGAISAIKSQLNLKPFSRSEISKYITDYESQEIRVSKIEEIQMEQVRQIVEKFMRDHFNPDNLYALEIMNSAVDGTLKKTTPEELEEFRGGIVSIEQFNFILVNVYNTIKNRAVKLMQYARREYNLEE